MTLIRILLSIPFFALALVGFGGGVIVTIALFPFGIIVGIPACIFGGFALACALVCLGIEPPQNWKDRAP